MSLSTKVEIYEQSVNALARCVKLEAILRDKDDAVNADAVGVKASSLAALAKRLREEIQAQWTQATPAKVTKLKSLNSDLQQEIAAIKRVIDHAARVVKAIGYVDDVIKVAVGLLT